MTTESAASVAQTLGNPTPPKARRYPYDDWMEAQGLPIYRGFFVPDLREIELTHSPLHGCPAAFMQLVGQEGIVSAHITEVPAGASLPPMKFALDEAVYVLSGRGVTTVWAGEDRPKRTFEWQAHSLFMLPQNHWHQFSNMQGDRPARLLHYNYLPLAMSAVHDPAFFFNNPYSSPAPIDAGASEFYSEAAIIRDANNPGGRAAWSGNFFPDMQAWDRLVPFRGRGAGGHVVGIRFPGAEIHAHMSVFPAQTYKKAHRHGPGRVIVIPAGEGYSIMWPEGHDKVVVPWHEGSVFVPPDRWFHQHFNVGSIPARYLALHPPYQFFGMGETVQDLARDQIEYPDEDPFIRAKFEDELGRRGLKNLIPEVAYQDRTYEWAYEGEE